ncbi:MAG: GntR family transcriptional regulator [Paracoccaceae bacterium]
MPLATAYQEFRDRLLSGELSPGQFVTQKELAELVGVPIGTARQVIQKLEHESLLKVHPQRGIQITDITTKFIRDSYGLRLSLELHAITNFASSEFTVAVKSLLKVTREARTALLEDMSDEALERALLVDWEMHDKIIGCMGNDLLTETYQINAARLRLIRVNNRLTHDRAVAALDEHIEILEHCEAQDTIAATAALNHHIDTSMSRSLQGK